MAKRVQTYGDAPIVSYLCRVKTGLVVSVQEKPVLLTCALVQHNDFPSFLSYSS